MKVNIKLPLMCQCRCSDGNEGEEYIGKESESVFIGFYLFSLFYRVRHKSVNTPVRHMSVNTPSSHKRHVVCTWLAVYSGWG